MFPHAEHSEHHDHQVHKFTGARVYVADSYCKILEYGEAQGSKSVLRDGMSVNAVAAMSIPNEASHSSELVYHIIAKRDKDVIQKVEEICAGKEVQQSQQLMLRAYGRSSGDEIIPIIKSGNPKNSMCRCLKLG